jgi:magnesium transporter
MSEKMQQRHPYVELVKRWIDHGLEFNIIELFSEMHPADIAYILDRLDEQERQRLFALLDVEKASDVITQLSNESRDQILQSIPEDVLIKIVDDMDSDDAADLLAELPRERAEATLRGIPLEDSLEVQKLLRYDKESAGGLMQVELATVHPDMTVQDALDSIRKQAKEVKDIHDVFVVDRNNKLLGVVHLEDLILNPPQKLISEIMDTMVQSVTPDLDQEEVARIFMRYDIITLPVVDTQGRLLGRITVDDVVDVMEEEASEDFLKMAGTHEDELVYSGHPIKVSRLRLPWLITNLFGGLLVGYLMWLFKITLKEALVLVTFVPVITGMGGNAGIQSTTITVRGFAIGRVDFRNLWRHLFHEIRVGLLMGIACGGVVALIALLWHHNPMLGAVVGLAMFCAISVATLMGTLMPAFFKRLGIDPAVASGPFVTTANDITGILIYLSIATLFLKMLIPPG